MKPDKIDQVDDEAKRIWAEMSKMEGRLGKRIDDGTFRREDRDLLVELKTEMGAVRNDIKGLRDVTSARILVLEKEKADRKELQIVQDAINEVQHTINNDIEKRLRHLEDTRVTIVQGIKDNAKYQTFLLALAILIFGILVWHITGYHL